MRDGLGILLGFGGNTWLKALADEYAGRIKHIAGTGKRMTWPDHRVGPPG